MDDSSSRSTSDLALHHKNIPWPVFFVVTLTVLLSSPFAYAQGVDPSAASVPAACPVQLVHFNPGGGWSGLNVQIRNTSGKTVVGLVFNAALADATEHWKWLHWDFDNSRPIRNFGWNKRIKNGAAKTLSWSFADLDFEHSGGGAFVLTSVLFEDGSVWEEASNRASCKVVWYNSHKKEMSRPVALPFRE